MTLYRKRGSVVEATQMPTVFTATGRHGDTRQGMPGDWLLRAEDGAEFVMDSATMLLEYEPVAAPEPPQAGARERLGFTLKRRLAGEGSELPWVYDAEMYWCGAPAYEFEDELIRLKEAVDQKLRDVRRGWRPEGRL